VQPIHSPCADVYHTLEYVSAAAKALQPEVRQDSVWITMQARRLKQDDRQSILGDLRAHSCENAPCLKTDQDECTIVAAIRYLTRNGKHMDYKRFIAEGLPIGSGEVEGRIRQPRAQAARRPGDWREHDLALLTALLTFRNSGWWDEFWDWQDERDEKRLQRRLLGEGLNRFRGPRKPRLVSHGTERLELDGLSPTFQGAEMA